MGLSMSGFWHGQPFVFKALDEFLNRFYYYYMKIKFHVLLIMVIFILPLEAQNTAVSTGSGVFAPFVSRLQGEVKNNLVRLSWVDSPDVRGPVLIYRSTLPFNEAGPFRGPRPVEIPYGIQYYVDEIETGGTVYYFAAASDETGFSYDIPIIFTNTIGIQDPEGRTVPAAAESASTPSPLVVEQVSASAERPVIIPYGISSLNAAVQKDSVILTFTEGNVKSATLYRSIRPLLETSDLLGAVIIETNISSPFTDYPFPGIPYYYAVIAEEELIRGTAEIIPGSNATLLPVEVNAGVDSRGRNIRAIPLPQISVKAAVPGMNAYNDAPAIIELSPEAVKAIGNIPVQSRQSSELKKPRVFARDMETTPEGVEEYTLSSVVRGPFADKNWEAARDELVRFLALPRSPEITGRARFYLGQCHYFLRQPREGLFEFLAIRDRYPLESMEWIQASLDMMKE